VFGKLSLNDAAKQHFFDQRLPYAEGIDIFFPACAANEKTTKANMKTDGFLYLAQAICLIAGFSIRTL